MALVYKKTEDGKSIVMSTDGHPIMFDDAEDEPDEVEIDAIGLYTKVPELKSEAKKRRLEVRDLKEKLSTFDGIDEPEAALKAIATVRNLSDGDLVKAEDVSKLKEKLSTEHKSEIEKLTKENLRLSTDFQQREQGYTTAINRLVISNAFKSSERLKNIPNVPPDMLEDSLSKFFKAETLDTGNTVPVGHYANGEIIYSKKNPSEIAGFDEAVDILISMRPDKDKLAAGKTGGPDFKAPGHRQQQQQQSGLPGSTEKIATGLRSRGYNF